MHVQAAVVEGQLAAQRQLRQGLLVQRLAGLAQERFEDAAFGKGQADLLAVDLRHAARQVQRQVAQLHLRAGLRRVGSPQHGAQPCGEFARVAGLGQVVVGAQFQTEDAVQRLAAGGQHQHRQVGMVAAQLLEQFQAATVRQHHVEHHGIRCLLGEGATGLGAVVAGTHGETFLDQPGTEQLAELPVIVDQQQFAHRVSLN